MQIISKYFFQISAHLISRMTDFLTSLFLFGQNIQRNIGIFANTNILMVKNTPPKMIICPFSLETF